MLNFDLYNMYETFEYEEYYQILKFPTMNLPFNIVVYKCSINESYISKLTLSPFFQSKAESGSCT